MRTENEKERRVSRTDLLDAQERDLLSSRFLLFSTARICLEDLRTIDSKRRFGETDGGAYRTTVLAEAAPFALLRELQPASYCLVLRPPPRNLQARRKGRPNKTIHTARGRCIAC